MFLKKTLEQKLASSLNELKQDGIPKQETESKKVLDKRINFPIEFKKFGDDHMSEKAKEAKKDILKFRDPDILELQDTKNWNISTKPGENTKTDLKRTLFEVKNTF